jgi:2-polyprenyl-3-methyl-5-hydroxy-6-metoxy-1,4-benzoquinol methylase|tara:strand:+ start:247 stop:1392 length:1146 start_codon:yes stop_codon:yes gene_type:complete
VEFTACRLCGRALTADPILALNGMPRAAQFYPTDEELSSDKGIALDIYQCGNCGLVQHCLDPVSYYKEVITATSFSEKTRLTRLEQMTHLVTAFNLKGKKALEVGSAKGHMLDIMSEAGMDAVGIEFSAESVAVGRAAGRTMIQGYIGDLDLVEGGPYDAFISLNYFEHLPDPASIIEKIYANTTTEGVGFVTVPNLEYLLESNCLYEFVADHLSYFTQQTLSHAFEAHGFDVLECELINERNDIAITVQKRAQLALTDRYSEILKLSQDLRKTVSDYVDQGKKVAVWGAGHRTLALLALSELDDLSFVVDSAVFKHGKRTPVLHLDIVAPERLLKGEIDLIIIMVPGLYPDEVLQTIRQMDIISDVAILRGNQIDFIADK